MPETKTIKIETGLDRALQNQLVVLEFLEFNCIRAYDEIAMSVSALRGMAFALGIPKEEIPPINFENKIWQPETKQNIINFYELKGRIKSMILNRLQELDEKKLEVLASMGEVTIPTDTGEY
jgi:hypothetical protein